MNRPYRIALGIIGIVTALIFGVWLLLRLRAFVVLLIIAGVFAAALDRPVNFLQRVLRLKRRGLAVFLTILLTFLVLVGMGYLVYRPIADQGSTLRADFPSRVERLKDLPLIGPRLRNIDLKGETEQFFAELPKRLEGNRELILGAAQTALTALFLMVTTIVIIIFFLLKGPAISQGMADLIVDPGHEARARRLGRGMLDAVAGYVLGNLLISVCAAAVTFLSLTVMGAPFAAVLAVVMAIVDLIPLVGATLGGVIVTAATFVLDPEPWKALAFAVIFIVYQQVENHTLYPVIMGRTVKIGTFSVFLISLAGVELAGILGALLAIPIGAAANVIVQDLLTERKRKALTAPPPSLAA